MAIHLGSSEKLNIIFLDGRWMLATPAIVAPMTDGIKLLTFDNYILKDSQGLYLTIEEDE